MTKDSQATLSEVKEGAAWITLDRAEARNALSAQLVTELHDHLQEANSNEDVRAVVITAAGPVFCAGADLKNPPGQALDGARAVSFPDLLNAIVDGPKPVIAAINGAAFGGGLGIIAAADIAIAAEEAVFSFSEVRIGVIPAVISVVCLPKLGTHHGMKLFLTGERFSGRDAVGLGLVHRAVPGESLQEAVQEEIDMIRQGGPVAMAECKKLVRRVSRLSREEAFRETSEWTRRMFGSDEAAEGMAAFREKRKPSWQGGD